jgi:hypothetical protein
MRPEPEDNARARLARELVSFEQRFGGNVGYCYIKLPTGEQTIRTSKPPPVTLTLAQQAQLAAIRNQQHIPQEPPAQTAEGAAQRTAAQGDERTRRQPQLYPQPPAQPAPRVFRRKRRSTDTRTIPGKEEQ